MYLKISKTSITKIQILKTDCKLSLSQVVSQYKPDYVINGGLYDMKTTKPNSIPLRIDGKTIATSKDGYWCFAWNEGPDIKLIHSKDMNNYKNVLACSAMLKDGANTIFTYTSAQGGVRGRTAIGTDPSNLHLFVTTDTNGPLKPESLRDKMKSNGCRDAIMLDCGGSSQMYADGKYYQAEKRKVSYWILVWTKNIETIPSAPTTQNPYSIPSVTLKIGSTGLGVKWLQFELVKRGFLDNSNGKQIDGIFGAGTAAAVKKLQSALGFTGKDVDGIVGKGTRSRMI